MARIAKKFIKLGTSTDELNSRDVPANYSPTNYTPSQVASEGTDKISAHLKGIDTAIGSLGGSAGDISETSFSLSNNQVSAANVTGFAFANGSIRSFQALVSVAIDATTDLFESFEILGIQKASDWQINVSSLGDTSQVSFSITSAGQIQYTSGNISGFVSGTIKFRAITTSV